MSEKGKIREWLSTWTLKKIVLTVVVGILLFWLLDQMLFLAVFFISSKPKCIYRHKASGEKVEVYYHGGGAFSSDWLLIKVNGEPAGSRYIVGDPGSVTQVECFPDSFIVHTVRERIADTSIIYRSPRKDSVSEEAQGKADQEER